ncbi:hypothetical protein AB0I53_45815 [Saccharopolyspora sp. NPDC050389]|uniref:hypothetical protein n=1 Tax=Saccharopolyspora sp. NPDC050389 TaxID=3155516 RepID=UPI0033D3BB8B
MAEFGQVINGHAHAGVDVERSRPDRFELARVDVGEVSIDEDHRQVVERPPPGRGGDEDPESRACALFFDDSNPCSRLPGTFPDSAGNVPGRFASQTFDVSANVKDGHKSSHQAARWLRLLTRRGLHEKLEAHHLARSS